MKKIDGNSFLMNVFLELIKRNKLEISFINLIKLEYNFLNLLDDDNVILENSGHNIIAFVKKYEEYLDIMEKDGKMKIFISKEEDFRDVLLEEYEQDLNNNAKYKRSLKKVINEEKKAS